MVFTLDPSLGEEVDPWKLVAKAQEMSIAPISNFRVGALGVTESGHYILGCNLESCGEPPGLTVHAEQFLVSRCWWEGLGPLKRIYVSAPPCGHCRQFLWETVDSKDLEVCVAGSEKVLLLSQLLPSPFGPRDLGIERDFWESQGHSLMASFTSENKEETLDLLMKSCIARSYTPYTKSKQILVLELKDRFFGGASIESAAFNPTLGPLQSLLIQLQAYGLNWDEVVNVWLYHDHTIAFDYRVVIKSYLKRLAPRLKLKEWKP